MKTKLFALAVFLLSPVCAFAQLGGGGPIGTTTAALPESVVISWSGDLGTVGNAGVSVVVAPCKGHFTQLQCTATLTGSCTTGPTVNVTDVTASTTGSAVSPTTTVATVASAAQTLAFNSGDTIGMAQTATTGTCTAPRYACNAVATCP